MNKEQIIMGEAPDEKAKSNKSIFIAVGILLIVISGLVFLLQPGEKVISPDNLKTPSVAESTLSAKEQPSVVSENSSKLENMKPITTKEEIPEVPKLQPQSTVTVPEATPKKALVDSETPSATERTTLPSTKETTKLAAEEQAPIVFEKTQASEKSKTIKKQEINEVSQTKTSSMTNLLDFWVVKDGDSLWNISHNPLIYGDPFRWAKIYEANKYQIKNPDIIYPGQKIIIPRD